MAADTVEEVAKYLYRKFPTPRTSGRRAYRWEDLSNGDRTYYKERARNIIRAVLHDDVTHLKDK
jgi:hypothetical protein